MGLVIRNLLVINIKPPRPPASPSSLFLRDHTHLNKSGFPVLFSRLFFYCD